MTIDVAVIVNANARKFVDCPARIESIARLAEGRAHFFVTRDGGELDGAIARARDDGARVLVLCGGDGSYGAGVTSIARAWEARALPVVALAPGGTVGTVPRAIGAHARGETAAAVGRVLHRACALASMSERDARAATLAQPTLSIRADGAAERLAFIFGTGLVASFFELYDPRGAALGRAAAAHGAPASEGPSGGDGYLAAARIVARVFVESFVGGAYARRVLEPLRCDVDVDGERVPWLASSLVVASVVRDLGLGMRVTHRAAEDPLRPHVVVSGLSPRTLGPRMTRVLSGRPIGDPGEPHLDALVRELKVEFPSGAGPYVLDGDLRIARQVVVSAGPTLRVLGIPRGHRAT